MMTIPEIEEEVLKYWQEEKIFEKSIENRKDAPLYAFYDGPPFATGTPHYGHIVASTMKDVVPRYWTMRGFNVPRRWGWDCHGLPIENIAENSLGIKSKKDIEKIGVAKFNETCRSKVLEYVAQWEKLIPRLGRWVDMKNAYRTMDLDFMESVWWVFKSLYDKGLIYEGYRSIYICPRCETTLSQSEVSEGYRNIKDLSVIAKFELIDEPDTSILAWTTTPWTLIANVALAINPAVIYCNVKCQMPNDDNKKNYILAKDRIKDILKDVDYEITEEFKGEKLIGKKYKPLFDYYQNTDIKNKNNGWKIVPADFVETSEGTGIVHIAPGFGEDDLNLSKNKNLPFIQHIGMDGVIKSECKDFVGLNVKPIDNVQKTDVEIIKYLAEKNLLFSKAQYEHSYPHCWRCETPLINFATSSWFMAVEKVKDEAITLAEKIHWSPAHMKKGRFGMWLKGARDWSISRQRYWASVIPIWRCGCGEIKVIGSIKELEELSGNKISDLHKDKINPITIKCPKCQREMHRIPDVLDTWFDSGSMPYAQMHYPFENNEAFDKSFPAEFIAEGQDQTRCWFYYLHLISTIIKHDISYKNVVVNGIVLAEDGKKMSKRLKNYPDPIEIIDKYGADTLRLYLLTSSVMQAENLNFSEYELAEISRGVMRMLLNSYNFYKLYADIYKWKPTNNSARSKNVLDKWIISELEILIQNINQAMERYDLVGAARQIAPFVDNLSNWYIRQSRNRFKNCDTDQNDAFQTLHNIFIRLSQALAPFIPFISDYIYRSLSEKLSVHLEDYPQANLELIKNSNETKNQMLATRSLIEIGLAKRKELGTKYRVRQPLQSIKYGQTKLNKEFEDIIAKELNAKDIVFSTNFEGIELDTKLTTVLLDEGKYNDLVRNIQDLRKAKKLNPNQKVILYYKNENNIADIFKKYEKEIIKDTNLKKIEEKQDLDSGLDLEEKL